MARITVDDEHADRLNELCAETGYTRSQLLEMMLTNAEESLAYYGDEASWLERPIVDTPPL